MTITTEEALIQMGLLIKKYRKKANLSCRDLGKRAKVSYTVLYEFENSKGGLNLGTLIKIANTLEIPAEEIGRALREEVPSLRIQKQKAKCCGNCKYFKNGDYGFHCELLKIGVLTNETCVKFKEVEV
jgi:transcriptional regulator with XRE-family HTH domain